MSATKFNKQLFDSLVESFTKYNAQLNEINNKNIQNFAKLFDVDKLKNAHELFNHENHKTISAEQLKKINQLVQENITDFGKLCAVAEEVNLEYRDLIIKIIDFYVQLYPSRETYSLAGSYKKMFTDSVVVCKDYIGLMQNFISSFSKQWIK